MSFSRPAVFLSARANRTRWTDLWFPPVSRVRTRNPHVRSKLRAVPVRRCFSPSAARRRGHRAPTFLLPRRLGNRFLFYYFFYSGDKKATLVRFYFDSLRRPSSSPLSRNRIIRPERTRTRIIIIIIILRVIVCVWSMSFPRWTVCLLAVRAHHRLSNSTRQSRARKRVYSR